MNLRLTLWRSSPRMLRHRRKMFEKKSGPGYSSKVYTRKGNKRYSTALFTFGNGKLNVRSQYGLR